MNLGMRRRLGDVAGSDPIGRRIRSLRLARGLSLQKLSARVDAAPSHIFHIENGDKVPSEPLAVRIARALGEDEEVFRAWARLRRRAPLLTALEAAPVLARYLARVAEGGAAASRPGAPGVPAVPRPVRILVPLIPEGADPGHEARPPETIGMLRLSEGELGTVTDLDRLFAYPASGPSLRRVPDLLAEGRVLVLTRSALPMVPQEVYAVRRDGGVELARALWSGSELLLPPAPGASDFVVLPASSAETLARLIVGRVVLACAHAPAP